MTSNFIEVLTQKGTQFIVIFIAGFMGLYLFFQTPFMTDINKVVYKNSFDFFLENTLTKLKIWTEVKNPKDPFLFTINFYSLREFEEKKAAAIKARKKTVDISTKKNDFNGRHMTNLYLPFILALFLATPLGWRKKIPATLVGLALYWIALMYIFVAKITLAVGQRGIGEYDSENVKALVQNIDKITNVGFFSVLVIFIWFITLVIFNAQKNYFSKPATIKT